MIVPIDDHADPRLDELRGLTDAQARAVVEAEHGCFVAEGLLTLEAVVASTYPLRSVLVAEPKVDRVLDVVRGTDVPVFVGSPELLEGVTGFPIHRGVVASVGRLPLPDVAPLLDGADRVLVAEGVNDHENLGSLFRNAAAFGVDAVLLDPTCADPLYRRSVRVSLGHVLGMPWTRVADPTALPGFTTLALTPGGRITVTEAAERFSSERIAWLVGAEGPGLTAATLAAADETVRIPIAAGVDSLNVATAAAIALHATATP